MKEEWRPVVGYEGHYEVSNFGNVRSLPRLIVNSYGRTLSWKGGLLTAINRNGYLSVSLSKFNKARGCQVHRLVAMAWCANPDNKITVNHKNGVKKDNRVENLEWASYSENNAHARETGLNDVKGANHGRVKLSESDVCAIRRMHGQGIRQVEIVAMFNVKQSTISNIIHRVTWRHLL